MVCLFRPCCRTAAESVDLPSGALWIALGVGGLILMGLLRRAAQRNVVYGRGRRRTVWVGNPWGGGWGGGGWGGGGWGGGSSWGGGGGGTFSGGGYDTHSAINRFLGLRSDLLLGERSPDTAFTRYGGLFKLTHRLTANDQLSFHYNRAQIDGGALAQ